MSAFNQAFHQSNERAAKVDIIIVALHTLEEEFDGVEYRLEKYLKRPQSPIERFKNVFQPAKEQARKESGAKLGNEIKDYRANWETIQEDFVTIFIQDNVRAWLNSHHRNLPEVDRPWDKIRDDIKAKVDAVGTRVKDAERRYNQRV